MAMYSNGKLVDSSLVFSEGQTLPNSGTSVNSTNAVYFGGAQSGKLVVNVAASTNISIANGQGLTIKIEYGTTSTPTSVLHDTIYSHTASGSADTWAAGDLICQYTIPADKAATYSYAELVYTTTASEAGEKLDAWISIVT
jgi:hypothetical protein